jgi:2-(1,2-epoxy-1,2-dihydrophenyl)acetyl-CoA isomerase
MTVRVERDNCAAVVQLGTGRRANSLTRQVRLDLAAALSDAARDDAVRALLLLGAPNAFSAGQDLGEHARLLAAGGGQAVGVMVREEFSPLARLLARMPKPTVAAMHGVAAGAGLGLALASDLRLAARSATFTTAFTGVGLGPDSGVNWSLVRAVGHARATDLLLRPRILDSDEALALGLVHEVVDDVALDDRAHKVVTSLAAGPTLAYAAVKTCLTSPTSLDETLWQEAELQATLAASEDHVEAVQAFLEKRSPTFTGR